MKFVNTILLDKTKNLESTDSENWESSLFARVVTELADEEHYLGSAYAEADSSTFEFKVSKNTERMLSKSLPFVVVAKYQSNLLTKFSMFVIKSVLKANDTTTASGIVKVKFSDEEHERAFFIAARYSGKVGDYVQIDQFFIHPE